MDPSRLASIDMTTFDVSRQLAARCVVLVAIFSIYLQAVVVAEWLRRWTRNPLGSARAGSNPADYVFLFRFLSRNSTDLYRSLKTQIQSKIKSGDFSVDSQNSLQQV